MVSTKTNRLMTITGIATTNDRTRNENAKERNGREKTSNNQPIHDERK